MLKTTVESFRLKAKVFYQNSLQMLDTITSPLNEQHLLTHAKHIAENATSIINKAPIINGDYCTIN